MADIAGWAQAGVAGLVAGVGTVVWVAEGSSALHQTQAQVQQMQAQQQADHDKVVTQDQKLKDIADDVSEIKNDVKTLVQKVK